GEVKYLGNCFSSADRKTDVDIAMVTVRKQAAGRFDFQFENLGNEKKMEFTEDTLRNPIAVRDVIGNMILRFEKVQALFEDFLKVNEGLAFYADGLLPERVNLSGVIQEVMTGDTTLSQRFNRFSDRMRSEIWRSVMDKINLQQYMTYAVR